MLYLILWCDIIVNVCAPVENKNDAVKVTISLEVDCIFNFVDTTWNFSWKNLLLKENNVFWTFGEER